MGFISCLEDPDLWMRKEVSDTGDNYYQYVFLYVDNLLVISGHPNFLKDNIEYYFPFNMGSVGPQFLYLG